MILSKLIKESDPIKITKIEGLQYHDDHLEIGMRIGPEYSDEAAIHELAHFIEMEDDRIGKPMWGMRVREGNYITEYGAYVNTEFTTLKHVEREARVWAIQYILQNELFNMPVTEKELASSSQYLPDVWHLIGIEDSKVQMVAEKMIKDYLKKYSLEGIKKEYHKKIKLLKNYLNQK